MSGNITSIIRGQAASAVPALSGGASGFTLGSAAQTAASGRAGGGIALGGQTLTTATQAMLLQLQAAPGGAPGPAPGAMAASGTIPGAQQAASALGQLGHHHHRGGNAGSGALTQDLGQSAADAGGALQDAGSGSAAGTAAGTAAATGSAPGSAALPSFADLFATNVSGAMKLAPAGL